MNTNDEIAQTVEMKKKLIQKRKELRQKLELLKLNQFDEERKFSPITKHLETIVNKLDAKNQPQESINNKLVYETPKNNKNKQAALNDIFTTPVRTETSENRLNRKVTNLRKKIDEIKQDFSPIKFESDTTDITTEAEPNVEQQDETVEYDPVHDSENYDFDEILERSVVESRNNVESFIDTPIYQLYLNDFHELPRTYIDGMLHDTKNKDFDHRTGVRHDSFQEKYYIGSEEINFEGPDIKIKNSVYKGTPGIYELLFKSRPKQYTPEDLENYQKILEISSAHKKNFNPDEKIQGSRSEKYKSIVAPLVSSTLAINTPKKIGKGMLKEVSNNSVDYKYWDNPNELVDRLRLLIASQTAGHTGHSNEIVSIVEELRESGVIK